MNFKMSNIIKNLLIGTLLSLFIGLIASMLFWVFGWNNTNNNINLPMDISGINWVEFKNNDGQYIIRYPEGWTVVDHFSQNKSNSYNKSAIISPYENMLSITITTQTGSGQTSFNSLDSWTRSQKSIYDKEKIISRQEYNTPKYHGLMVEFIYDHGLPIIGTKNHIWHWYSVNKNRGYIFEFGVNDDKWEEVYPLIQKILDNIEFIN